MFEIAIETNHGQTAVFNGAKHTTRPNGIPSYILHKIGLSSRWRTWEFDISSWSPRLSQMEKRWIYEKRICKDTYEKNYVPHFPLLLLPISTFNLVLTSSLLSLVLPLLICVKSWRTGSFFLNSFGRYDRTNVTNQILRVRVRVRVRVR